MSVVYRFLFPALWLSWAAYWLLAARRMKATERRESLSSRLLHILPLLFAFWLLWTDRAAGGLLNLRLFGDTAWMFWAAALLTAVGLGFTCWARVHLGRNWSGTVTLKEEHELIEHGPYAIVRHPIYTGLLLAFFGSAFARGDLRGLLAFLIAAAALWRKLRLEESWMVECFGPRYEDYRRRVPALLPFGKPREAPQSEV